MVTSQDFVRIKNDTKGNPRYKIHYSKLLTKALNNTKGSSGSVYITRGNGSKVKLSYSSVKEYQIFMTKESLLPFSNARITDKEYISLTSYNIDDICDIINTQVLD